MEDDFRLKRGLARMAYRQLGSFHELDQKELVRINGKEAYETD
ncbi:MAG: hypothetical protein QOF48_2584 [Verrucomicrobiota bacterium]